MTKFTKIEVLKELLQSDNVESTISYILSKMNLDSNKVESADIERLKVNLRSLRHKRHEKFEAANRMKMRFEKINAQWLNSDFHVSMTVKNEPKQPSSQLGRPSLEFHEMSDRSKRRKIAAISSEQKHDPERLIMACRYAANRIGNKNLYTVLSQVSENLEQPSKIRKVLETSVLIRKKSDEEALTFLLDNSLSKSVYTNMRLENKISGADIWPSYNRLREIKSQCRPPKEDISISEKKAEVTLQSLLNHTSGRIVELQRDVIIQHMQNIGATEIDVLMMSSWGMDGSTGHSPYKQSYKSMDDNVSMSDESLFVTTLIPLRLSTADSVILWNNRASQSPRTCRPIQIFQIKETEDIILSQKRNIEDQIDKLRTFVVALDDTRSLNIHFSLFLTLIDGKVLNIITGTKSMQTCPICHATPKLFNDLSNKQKGLFFPDTKSLMYGLSPLHAWIRILECCLHISYRLPVKAWQMRSATEKAAFAQRKKEIQMILWKELGLIVDKPKIGGSGTTNDGNTARRAFENPDNFAKHLGLDCDLVRNLKTILTAISLQLPIDPLKFGQLCSSTAQIYVSRYNWYPMPSTLHKILIHGADIVSTSILPIGMLGEEASEARNKDYKNYRQFHGRKHDRQANLYDVFYRAMDSSDPRISAISLESRIRRKKMLPITEDVRVLFTVPEVKNIEVDTASNSHIEEHKNEDTDLSETLMLLDEVELSDEDDGFQSDI